MITLASFISVKVKKKKKKKKIFILRFLFYKVLGKHLILRGFRKKCTVVLKSIYLFLCSRARYKNNKY